MFLNRKDLDAMILFNEKVDKLNNNSFTKIISEGFGINFFMKKDEDFVLEKRLPSDEEIDSFVLTIRFFIQDNELSSIRNLATETYSKLPDYRKEKIEFINARNKLNNYLDSPNGSLKIEDNGKQLVPRKIYDTIIYGELAHSKNRFKRDKYKEWMSHPIKGQILKAEFVLILSNILNCISFFRTINESLINDYNNCFKVPTT